MGPLPDVSGRIACPRDTHGTGEGRTSRRIGNGGRRRCKNARLRDIRAVPGDAVRSGERDARKQFPCLCVNPFWPFVGAAAARPRIPA